MNMKQCMKKTIAALMCLSLVVIMCLPFSVGAFFNIEDGRVRDRDGIIGDLDDSLGSTGRRIDEELKDGMDGMRGGMRTGSEATSDTPTVGATDNATDDGVLGTGTEGQTSTGTEVGTSGGMNNSATERPSGTETGTDGQGSGADDGDGIGAMGIWIAVIVAIVVIILIFIAIPKNKGKPGSTGKNH